MSSDQRRDQVLDAALHEFAQHGYYAARTSSIAGRVGVSQPYLYALFPDKKALFLACQDRVRERIVATFRAAAAQESPNSGKPASPEHESSAGSESQAAGSVALDRLAQGWRAMLPDADLMRCQLQGFAAAAADPEIRASVRQGVMDSVDTVVELTGARREQVADFVGRGLLLNIGATLELPEGYLSADPARQAAGAGNANLG